jgi:uncharacterized protein (TIGR00297 family)
MSAHSEDGRKIVHIATGAFALLLYYLTWWQSALLALLAVAFNVLVLPALAPRLYRPAERGRRTGGIVLYPVAVLALIVVFRERLDFAAAAWGILAAGDGAATLVGRRFGRRRLPWNPDKTLAGLLALLVSGGAAGALLAWWCRGAVTPIPPVTMTLAAPVLAALAAAFAETIPVRLDDNILVAAAAAAVLWPAAMVHPDAAALIPDLIRALPSALFANAAVAGAGFAAATVTAAGAVSGAVIGAVVVLGAGWTGWCLLLATFALAAATSRVGLRRKVLLGIAEERGGRRGPGNALANTGVAAVAAALAAIGPSRDAALVAFVASLTAAGSDTVASEIGKAWGRRTYLLAGWREVPPGTSGAVSAEGTIAGLAAACALATVGLGLGLIPASALAPAVVGALAGGLVESALGAALEGPGILNNDLLNFVNTAVAAAAALLLVQVVG